MPPRSSLSVFVLCMTDYNLIVSPAWPVASKKTSMVITRKVEFSASHVCRDPRLSDQENQRIYGMAANPHGHGHNYVVEVSLKGDPDPVTGMVLDLKELKAILEREVVEPYDHRFLNYEVAPFDQQVPTTENIALDIWRRLQPQLNGGGRKLHAIRVYETPDLYVDYFGESECSA